MSSRNAPGQLLGYTIQFPRAFCRLLQSGPGDSVCIEVLGDVATIVADGSIITEEDKSSTTANPLANKSINLWKTFANWIKAINSGEFDVQKTKFVLYCNKIGKSKIVREFSAAQNKIDAKSAIDSAKETLGVIREGHVIWEYYDLAINKNEELLIQVVERFDLQIGNNAGYDDVNFELQRKHIPKKQIDFLREKLGGWLYQEFSEKIALSRRAIITWDEFDHQFKVIFDRVRRMELIDFTLQVPIGEVEIKEQVKIRPQYLRQLEEIGVSDDDILEAVSDFLKAKVNRDKWIEIEIIDEDTAADFESKLQNFWKNQYKKIEITNKNLDNKLKGQLIFAECRSRAETIRNMCPPSSTIAGTYHLLADNSTLGWHPKWEKLFSK